MYYLLASLYTPITLLGLTYKVLLFKYFFEFSALYKIFRLYINFFFTFSIFFLIQSSSYIVIELY